MKFMLTIVTSLIFSSAFAGSKVDFLKPKDKEVVPQTFTVEFKVDGMSVQKAGEVKPGTGHHHLIIDGKFIPKGQVVPKNETHFHYGDASTSTSLTLKPGKHTLTMQFADGAHLSLGEEYSKTITVEVK